MSQTERLQRVARASGAYISEALRDPFDEAAVEDQLRELVAATMALEPADLDQEEPAA